MFHFGRVGLFITVTYAIIVWETTNLILGHISFVEIWECKINTWLGHVSTF